MIGHESIMIILLDKLFKAATSCIFSILDIVKRRIEMHNYDYIEY